MTRIPNFRDEYHTSLYYADKSGNAIAILFTKIGKIYIVMPAPTVVMRGLSNYFDSFSMNGICRNLARQSLLQRFKRRKFGARILRIVLIRRQTKRSSDRNNSNWQRQSDSE